MANDTSSTPPESSAAPSGSVKDTPAGTPPAPGPASVGGTGNSQVDAAVADVKSALDSVKPLLMPALTKADKKRLPKVSKAAQTLIDELVSLALSRPSLVPLGTDPKELSDELDHVGQLNTLMADVNVLHTGVGDTVTRMQADLSKAALDIYAIASRSGVADPGVAAVVAKMAKLLARGPRQKHVNVKVPVTTVTVPTGTAVPPPTGNLPVSQAAPKAGHRSVGKILTPPPGPGPASAPTAPSGNAGSSTPAATPGSGSGGSTPASPPAGNPAGSGTGSPSKQ